MLHLTNAHNGEILILNIRHIVSLRKDRGQVLIQVSTGVEYAVEDSYEDISKRPIWENL